MQYEIRHRLVCDDAEWKEQEQQRRVITAILAAHRLSALAGKDRVERLTAAFSETRCKVVQGRPACLPQFTAFAQQVGKRFESSDDRPDAGGRDPALLFSVTAIFVLPEADGGEVAHETCEHRDGVRVRLQRTARGQR